MLVQKKAVRINLNLQIRANCAEFLIPHIFLHIMMSETVLFI